MPLYVFSCPDCKTDTEVLQKYTDDAPTCTTEGCQNYQKPLTKKISRCTFELKGSGWAKDGYGS